MVHLPPSYYAASILGSCNFYCLSEFACAAVEAQPPFVQEDPRLKSDLMQPHLSYDVLQEYGTFDLELYYWVASVLENKWKLRRGRG